MSNEKIEVTKRLLLTALETEELRLVASQLDARIDSESLCSSFWRTGKFAPDVASQISACNSIAPGRFPGSRFLLIKTSLASLGRLPTIPVDDAVKSLMCDEFSLYAAADPDWDHLYDPDKYSFRALVGISLCQRFRAGLLDWEESGFPRSWLLKVPKRELLPTVAFLMRRMHGFSPFWFPHNAFLRGRIQMMRERDWDASILLMAKSIQLQPGIKGILTGSWFYSPETHRVTPHLAWTTRIFLDNGAFMTDIGPAQPDAGFQQGSTHRQELYLSGQYKPTETILLWPRKDILAWLEKRSQALKPKK